MKMMKKGYKRGGKMPDLSGDGEVTQEDVLIGRGVLDKKGKAKKAKKKRSDAMDAVTGTGPAAPRKAMKNGGMTMRKKGYAKGGKVRGAGIARKGTRPCKMR